ncbi:hypothetical protein EPUL_002507 [Erysiphe pulchra]|uniref:Uncharacterized protein n=1 Tax=Erysiphe pulchra TaxID=225359 RepID=A0A2S4PR59_9PEZI|nr:hypothetical protein EPUL_002507 [Erysiphe pulchra]
MLRNALDDRLITTLVGNHLLPEDDFDEWFSIVGHVAQQFEVVNGRNRRVKQPVPLEFQRCNAEKDESSRQSFHNEQQKTRKKNGRVGELDSSGDTIMGGINATRVAGEKQKRGRAKWKTPERIEQLKKEEKCFRPLAHSICRFNPDELIRKVGKLDAPAHSRTRELEVGRLEKSKDVDSMNTNPFLVNALLNDITMVQALVDNGCLCYGIIDESLVSQMDLPRILILPPIDSITYVSMDLDGWLVPKLWLHVVPESTHRMILGKKWLEDQDALIHSKNQQLELKKNGAWISSVRRWESDLSNIVKPQYTSVDTIALMIDEVPVCRASIEDISKALRGKPRLSIEE